MNVIVFNVCLLIGWLLVLIGLCIWSIPFGMASAGALLLLLTILLARLGGLQAPGAHS